jgi:regulator of cell morphogenesis and NO signaling
MIDANTTLADLVLDEPGRADLFDRLGFDYCCRGGRTLAEAATQRGLDLGTVVQVLEAHAVTHAGPEDHDFDWRRASTAELCDHIVDAYHEPLRRDLPRLADTLQTVARVHGGGDPQLNDLVRVFDLLASDLLAHVEHEEEVLFPACRALEAGERSDSTALLDRLEHDHAGVGEALLVIRDLAGGYRADAARCGTHRALMHGLEALERDLHRHIHEENNVLFPRVRGLLAA